MLMLASPNSSRQDAFMHQLSDICDSFDSQVRCMRDCLNKLEAERHRVANSLRLGQCVSEVTFDDDDVPVERRSPDEWVRSDTFAHKEDDPQVSLLHRGEEPAVASAEADPFNRNVFPPSSERQSADVDGSEHKLETRDPTSVMLGSLSTSLNFQVNMMWSVLEAKSSPSTSAYPKRSAVKRSLKRLQDAVSCFKEDMRVAATGGNSPEHGTEQVNHPDLHTEEGAPKTEVLPQASLAQSDVEGRIAPEVSRQSKVAIPSLNSREIVVTHDRTSKSMRTQPTSQRSTAAGHHLAAIAQGRTGTLNLNRISGVSISEWLAADDDEEKRFCVQGVMHPEWNGRLGWDMGVILLVLVDSMILPFQMAYKDSDNPDDFDSSWLWLTTCFFGMDFTLNFFTGYIADKRDKDLQAGRLVTNRVRIARNYMRGWMSIDFVSTVPWSALAEAITGKGGGGSAQMTKLTKVIKFVRFLRLMRMLRLAKLATIWERIEARLGSLLLVQSTALFRVLFVMFAICHWNACIWWMIGQPSSLIIDVMDSEAQKAWQALPHWVTVRHASSPGQPAWTWLERDTSDAYIFCVYWTLGVMRTMPAEVQPTNRHERCYVLIFMFFAFSAFAICVALITQTFFKMSERKRLFSEDMAYFRMHLRNIKAKESLQLNCKDYLKHLFARRKIVAKESSMLNHLPKALADKLKWTRLQGYIEKMDCLRGLPTTTLISVLEISEVKDMVAGDLLCCWGCPAEAAWVLIAGRLQNLGKGIHERKISSALPALPPGSLVDFADEDCLLSSAVTTSKQTVAVSLCSEVLRIDKVKFFNLMKKTPFVEKAHRDTMQQELLLQLREPVPPPGAVVEGQARAQGSDLRRTDSTDLTGATRDTESSIYLEDLNLEEVDEFPMDDSLDGEHEERERLQEEHRTGEACSEHTSVIMTS